MNLNMIQMGSISILVCAYAALLIIGLILACSIMEFSDRFTQKTIRMYVKTISGFLMIFIFLFTLPMGEKFYNDLVLFYTNLLNGR